MSEPQLFSALMGLMGRHFGVPLMPHRPVSFNGRGGEMRCVLLRREARGR